jgi:mRNA interferase RelE/StbE
VTKYAVEWKPAALRILKKLEPKIQKQILQDVVSLADDPRPHGCRKLAGHHDEWRIRSGT